ncbi:hypothetical protein GGF46_002236 [Coemansia sp. RSA 552]|nr:hypothetical protein GGF46_002236 [Coemansia sp. RSA 552]
MRTELDRLLSQIHTELGGDVAGRQRQSQQTGEQSPAASEGSPAHTGIAAIDSQLEATSEEQAGERPVIELVGLPGCGKTQIVYRICAAQARRGHVLLVDADGTADMRQLRGCVAQTEPEAGVSALLERIHVFTPDSTSSLVATLAMLPRYVAQRQIGRVAMVVVEGIGSSNLLIDRKEASLLRLQIHRATPWFRQQQVLVDTLLAVCRDLDCAAIATNTLLFRAQDGRRPRPDEPAERSFTVTGHGQYRDKMIPRWQSMLRQTLVLESQRVGSTTRISFRSVGPAGDSHSQQEAVPSAREPCTLLIGQPAGQQPQWFATW